MTNNASNSQKNLLKGIENVVDAKLRQMSQPEFLTGIVSEDPEGFKCLVNIHGTERECILPEHLHDWVSKDDIVTVSDTRGNQSQLVILGSTGSTRKKTLVVNDEDKEKLVGGVTKFEDASGNLTDNSLTVE